MAKPPANRGKSWTPAAVTQLKQLAKENTLTANYLTVQTIGLRQCIEKVVEGSGWQQKWQ